MFIDFNTVTFFTSVTFIRNIALIDFAMSIEWNHKRLETDGFACWRVLIIVCQTTERPGQVTSKGSDKSEVYKKKCVLFAH